MLTFAYNGCSLVENCIKSDASVKLSSFSDLTITELWHQLIDVFSNCLIHCEVLWDEVAPFECVRDGKQNILERWLITIRVPYSLDFAQLTPFRLPREMVWVGRSTMNSPSTTGTVTNVPKSPSALIALLAVSRTLASAATRHANVSSASEHLQHVKSS